MSDAAASPDTDTDIDTDRVASWLAANLGEVIAIRRQPRWRPVWFAAVSDGDGERRVVVRGDRTDMELIFPLDHERRFQQLMHSAGLPVAKVHGWIDDPAAFVMDEVPGQPYLLEAGEDERRTVMDEYMDALANLHLLDIGPFVDADIVRAPDPSESGLVGLARYEERYRRAKRGPDPLLEFALGWLRRNPADSRGREAPIVWDSGQFHHRDGHLVALLDIELAHIGDPMMDLAAFRMRDTIGGFGDFADLYARWERTSGRLVDLDAVKHHHIAFTLTNRLAFSAALRQPPPGSDLMTNLQWCRETDLFTTEALAEYLGIDLPTVELPPARETRAAVAHRQLVQTLRSVTVDDDYLRYELRTAFRLARHAQRSDEIEDELNAADLEDLVPLLGHRSGDWWAGEAALEQFILEDDGTHDRQLVEILHKRNLRAQALLGPAGSAMTTHHGIQPFHA